MWVTEVSKNTTSNYPLYLQIVHF
uniref:Uncharacterized protein n=1 Tax=Arundo donax TaxID=35708 RepID=A0A0A9FB22_ARUDO